MKSAGPQSQLLAGVITEKSRSPSAEGQTLSQEGLQEAREEPEPPNPFNELTDQELEDYKREVEQKQLGLDGSASRSLVRFDGANHQNPGR
ncbi:hypothetical protein scyTo_0024878 [Scyliorhinus torazame]|uniref:Uncharacterized protein n=1 Tax=Scyliorhinus torazame TaxID=75743 RepID=A0A401QFZ3_SCYTO|nr:hypothetical protein [Scyliorhinus torazame]